MSDFPFIIGVTGTATPSSGTAPTPVEFSAAVTAYDRIVETSGVSDRIVETSGVSDRIVEVSR